MNSTASLTGSHRRTYEAIFQHPPSPHPGWTAVQALFRQLGQVEVEANGKVKVTRNGQVLILPAPRTQEVAGTDELMALRHFLERSEGPPPGPPGPPAQWLEVIDHREARIYRSAEPGAVSQQIRPHVAEDFFRHAHNSMNFSRGQEKPDPNSFFEPVAGVLNGAGEILIFGPGTGSGSEMEQFVAWLKANRPELARRVVGAVVVDLHHLTEAQLLAKARAFLVHDGAA